MKAESRTAAEIRMDLAVLPETNCQGLFNQFKLSSVACKAVFNSKDNGKELNFRFHID